jgi:Xaa-Pro dipeptidase
VNDAAVAAIRRRLAERNLSGYVAATPSNLFYVTGFRSYFVSEWWRMHGTVFALVPADPERPVTLVLSDFEEGTARGAAPGVDLRTYRLWVDLHTAEEMAAVPGTADPAGRPEQYDDDELDGVLGGALRDLGMDRGAVATDLEHLPVPALRRLERCVPGARWADFTEDVYRVRLIKQSWEVERLALGVELSEFGMSSAVKNLQEGMTAHDVRLLYQAGVTRAALDDRRFAGYTDNWVLPAVGSRTSAGYGARDGGLAPGDLVKFDCGTTVGGYRCDGGRTFAYRHRTPEAERLYGVLSEAQRIARSMIRPGTVVGDVFRAAVHHVHTNGFPSYVRGHVGHSVGIDTFHEEPPYIGPGCTTVMEPGMVFAVEVPSYTPDVGAVMIEDMLVVTEDGSRLLHGLPHELTVV